MVNGLTSVVEKARKRGVVEARVGGAFAFAAWAAEMLRAKHVQPSF
jgi:hypothetical protein